MINLVAQKLIMFFSVITVLQMEHAEETTVHRRTLEVEKEETDELKQKYKVTNINIYIVSLSCIHFVSGVSGTRH